jgi:hypothetical protein
MKKEFTTPNVECASRLCDWLLTAWIPYSCEYDEEARVYCIQFPRSKLVEVTSFCERFLNEAGWEWVL